MKAGNDYKNITLAAIENKLPYLHRCVWVGKMVQEGMQITYLRTALYKYCRYLCDEDDGVSEAIIGFAIQYIGILKVHNL